MGNIYNLIKAVNGAVNGFVWGIPAIVCIVGAGVLLSVRTRFIQFRRFGYALKATIGEYVIPRLLDSYNAGIIVLLVFIGGFVTLLEKSGGAEAFARKVANFIDTRCKTQLAAWLGGILVFFSELGTPMIVGPIFAPIF